MASRGESGWQLEKSLADCMRYMLDNEVATDVCFEVGPPDGAAVKIRAHKYMLIARSPVFEAMFSSGMTECRSGPEATIRVEDIDAVVFKDLLSYIYSGSVSVNVKIAFSLMYPAKKYILPKLVRKCRKCLSDNLDVKNVIQVLDYSLLFDEEELKSKCLSLIVHCVNTVLDGPEILSASPNTLGTILQSDEILVKEIVLYDTCVAWAKHQLQRQRSIDNPTDQQIREILGDLLYKIRFPTMNSIEFAEISEGKNVLTGEEKASILYYFVTKKKSSQLMFPTKWRIGEEICIDRTVTCVTGQWLSTRSADIIDFVANQDISLTGFGLYTGFNGVGYDVDVEISQSTTSLFKESITVPFTGDSTPFKISIDRPIVIKAGIVHSVKALSYGSIGHYGQPCQTVCKKGRVAIMFCRNAESLRTRESCGQIPRLYFCCN